MNESVTIKISIFWRFSLNSQESDKWDLFKMFEQNENVVNNIKLNNFVLKNEFKNSHLIVMLWRKSIFVNIVISIITLDLQILVAVLTDVSQISIHITRATPWSQPISIQSNFDNNLWLSLFDADLLKEHIIL